MTWETENLSLSFSVSTSQTTHWKCQLRLKTHSWDDQTIKRKQSHPSSHTKGANSLCHIFSIMSRLWKAFIMCFCASADQCWGSYSSQATRNLKCFNYSQTTVTLFIRDSNAQIENMLYVTKYNNIKERRTILCRLSWTLPSDDSVWTNRFTKLN